MVEEEKIENKDLQLLLSVLPATVYQTIKDNGKENQLLEIVLDLGRLPTARYVDGEEVLRRVEVTQEELDYLVNNVGQFDDDNRSGITRTLHRISAIRNRRGKVVGVTCRVGRAVYGTLEIIEDIVAEGKSILFLGRPGVGKTTMLREMARILSESRRVVIVDTSNEIGGDGDIPHPAVGRARRMQVPRPSHQHETMIEAVENHNPEVIIIDEIGREQEAAAARTINERGVQLIGTAHGNTLENLLLNPTLSDLVGGIESVTLSDEEARRRGTQKTVLERRAPATFDILIEIQGRQRLQIHSDVTEAVDGLLRGQPVETVIRFRNDAGEIKEEKGEYLPPNSLSGRRGGSAESANGTNGRRTNRIKIGEGVQAEEGRAKRDRPTEKPNLSKAKTILTLSICAYGIARNRLRQAAKKLNVHVTLVDDVKAANVLVTLKSYYRQRPQIIQVAQQLQIPVYVLRANTVTQMERFLVESFQLEQKVDPFDLAITDAEDGINQIFTGENSVNLKPVGAAMRRYQHQIADQANLVSHSYGEEPNRYVRIFSTKRR